MPQGLTRCDCRVYCDHSYPEITIGTRANHRKDEKIMDIQARLGRAPYIRGHRVDIHTRHRDPHLPPFRPERAQDTTNGPSSSRAHGPEPSRSGVHRPQPSSSHPRPPDRGRLSTQTSPHTGHTEAALEMMESEIRMRALSFSTSLASPLVFVNEPANLPYIHEATLTPNSGTYQLKPAARVNVSFLEHENRLWEILGLVHVLPPCARRDEVENIIFLEIDRCNTEKELHWNQQRMHIDMGKVVVNNEINFVFSISRWEPAVLISMVVTAMMTELFYVPRQGGVVLLAGLHDLLDATSGHGPRDHDRHLPKDPRTICRLLHLDPVTETYLCCPTCWALTPYCAADNPVTREDPNPVIPFCQDRPTPESRVCGEQLWNKETIKGTVKCTPRLTYVHQLLKHWLGRLLSRPGIEDILDDYPKTASRLGKEGGMSDIWSSPGIVALEGPDGRPFLDPDRPAREGRYLFSIAVDGFNPFHMKTAKQVVTSTGFFAVLLNFPVHLRHLLENMCLLGTGPGPFGPTVGRLNPFLDLIVRDFLELYEGVFYTRTAKYRSGREAKAMLIPLNADMLGARETAGLTSATSKHFCIGCHIDMAHIEEFTSARWPQRSHTEHLKHAQAWRDAPNVAAQQKMAEMTGIRFSALLNLPYWQVVRYVLVEPMHALDLDMIQRHIRKLFMIDLSADGGDGSGPRVPRPARPTDNRMTEVLNLFCQHRNSTEHVLLETLMDSPWATFETLWHICKDRHLRVAGNLLKKEWFILRIKKWIDENEFSDDEIRRIRAPVASAGEALAKLVSLATAKLSSLSAHRLKALNITETDCEDCIKLLKSLYRGTKFASITAKVNVMVNLCALRGVTLEGKKTRQQMYELLMEPIIDERSRLPPADLVNRGPVLGVDVMRVIWADMRKTVLPSWIGAAPKNWGTAKRGKLSADHLRTIFTVHLPITLIWLWRDETGRKKELLRNMLALVLAVVAANYKSTDLNTADYFDDCMRKYMNGVALLFKENSITPSQHSAFHIGQNLREFGPGHSRSAHHYERYIHHLQRQNTNGKFGEIENTFMYSTARMANLKALLSDNGELRTQVAGTVKAYDLIAGLKVLDSNDSHFDLASKAQWGSLSVRERQLLKGYLGQKYTPFDLEDWRASGCIMDQISVDGVKYACQNVSKYDRDSHILFKVPGKEAAPGKILNIVQYWHTTADGIETKDIYLVVDRFDPNPVPPEQDPYRQHPGIFGHLAGVIPVETCIIEASHIQSHFGLTPIKFSDELDVMHVYPLSRAKNQHWQWNEDPGLDNNEDDEMWDEDDD